MNLIQQLAEYQNAPLPTLEAAKKGANPNVSPWVAGAILSDRIEKEKRMAMGQGAAQGPMPTVDEQQDQEVAGIMGALNAPQALPGQAAPQEPVMAASGGLMDAPVDPGMFDFCCGGIIAFEEGGKANAKSAEEKQREDDQAALAKLWETIKGANRDAGAAIADVATLPIRGLAGAYDTAVVRPMRAAGIDAGYLSKHLVPEGVDPSSMTPFYDKYARGNAPQPAPKEDKNAEVERLIRDTAAGGEGRGNRITPEQAAEVTRRNDAIRAQQAAAQKAADKRQAPAAAPSGAPRAPAAGGVMSALTSSDEWKDLNAARQRMFEQPQMGQTARELAAERESHLKAQGITKKPWELASEQTAALRKAMGEEDATRKKDLADRETDDRWRTFVANLGSGSFGQSAQGGLRANLKREEGIRAEDQRIKEMRYNQNLKLNEIDAKAQELRYNEATGDVAAAQKNRQEIAALKRQFEKDQAAIAQGQAGVRERAAAADAQNATTLAAARERMGASGALTPKQIADIRDKAYDNINNKVKAGGVPLQMAMKKDPQMFERMVQEETNRLLATYTGGTMPAPSATGAGGKSPTGWGKAQVVK